MIITKFIIIILLIYKLNITTYLQNIVSWPSLIKLIGISALISWNEIYHNYKDKLEFSKVTFGVKNFTVYNSEMRSNQVIDLLKF